VNPPSQQNFWETISLIVGVIVGLITIYRYFSARERFKLVSHDDPDGGVTRVTIYNPMSRALEIQKIVYEVRAQKTWHVDSYESRLPRTPFTIEPFKSFEFKISAGQHFSSNILGPARIRVVSSAGRTYRKNL